MRRFLLAAIFAAGVTAWLFLAVYLLLGFGLVPGMRLT